jgi:hypothetical protein
VRRRFTFKQLQGKTNHIGLYIDLIEFSWSADWNGSEKVYILLYLKGIIATHAMPAIKTTHDTSTDTIWLIK